MDPLVGIGLFVGIPVGLAALIAMAIMVPQRYGSASTGADTTTETEGTGGLITSSPAAPDPMALPSANSRAASTGGARGHW
jgi:hypothetical protein